MNAEIPQKSSLKQKAAHEFREIAIVFFYLAVFFYALATYTRSGEAAGGAAAVAVAGTMRDEMRITYEEAA